MILLDDSRARTADRSGLVAGTHQELLDVAWRDDVALEMWIDVTSEPVSIRLAGVLDESTGANLFDVVADCMAQGRARLPPRHERAPF